MKFSLPQPAHVDGAIWHYDAESPRFARHHHDELELNLVVAGRAAYLIGDQRVEVGPRSLLWLLPRQEHLLIDISEDFEMWVASFRARLVNRVCVEQGTRPLRARSSQQVLQRRIPLSSARELSQLCERVATQASPSLFNAGLGYVLAQAAAKHAASGELAHAEQVHPAVERAAHVVSREPALSATELAARCGLSPGRLGRLFYAQLGQSLVSFRNRQRITYVLEHFEPAHSTLLHTALEAGFGSYAQFHRVFRQVTGKSPAAYKRALSA
jgi:AraC-like DNA-binding protein